MMTDMAGIYYWHIPTGTTQWERPAPCHPVPTGPSHASRKHSLGSLSPSPTPDHEVTLCNHVVTQTGYKTNQQLIYPHWPIIFSEPLCCPLVDVSCRHIFWSFESFRQHRFRQLVWPRPHPDFFMSGPYPYPVLKLFLILCRQCSFLWICQQLLLCKYFYQSSILQYGQYFMATSCHSLGVFSRR